MEIPISSASHSFDKGGASIIGKALNPIPKVMGEITSSATSKKAVSQNKERIIYTINEPGAKKTVEQNDNKVTFTINGAETPAEKIEVKQTPLPKGNSERTPRKNRQGSSPPARPGFFARKADQLFSGYIHPTENDIERLALTKARSEGQRIVTDEYRKHARQLITQQPEGGLYLKGRTYLDYMYNGISQETKSDIAIGAGIGAAVGTGAFIGTSAYGAVNYFGDDAR